MVGKEILTTHKEGKKKTLKRGKKSKYSFKIKAFCLIAFVLATLGWLNEVVFHQFEGNILFGRYLECFIIVGFGIWRAWIEKNPYTKKRLAILVLSVLVIWTIIPSFKIRETTLTYAPSMPILPNIHLAGTVTFFMTLFAVWLWGRRVICGWNCPCVGIRETVGFVFRSDTIRSETAWKLRHLKWIFFAFYVVFFGLTLFPLNSNSAIFYSTFAGVVGITYYTSMFLAPYMGNRNYCRYLCPYGATFGLLNKIGFYKIDFEKETCINCGKCKKVCDMGIPVVDIGIIYSNIKVADCMGCGRCVTECPTNSLAFYDVRDVLFGKKIRNKQFLFQNNKITPTIARYVLTFSGGLLLFFLIIKWY